MSVSNIRRLVLVTNLNWRNKTRIKWEIVRILLVFELMSACVQCLLLFLLCTSIICFATQWHLFTLSRWQRQVRRTTFRVVVHAVAWARNGIEIQQTFVTTLRTFVFLSFFWSLFEHLTSWYFKLHLYYSRIFVCVFGGLKIGWKT